MSEDEQARAIGKLRLQLRTRKAHLVAITTELKSHRDALKEVAGLLDQFIRDPEHKNPSHVPIQAHLKAQIERLVDVAIIIQWLEEFRSETSSVKELQQEIDKL